MGSTLVMMVGVGSPMGKSQSMVRLHSTSPSQAMARKLVRKYSLGTITRGTHTQRRELSNLRTTLPHMKRASDLDLVLEAIKYIEQLQQKVVCMSKIKEKENMDMCSKQPTE